MAFLDYIKEATSWIFETILSGTLDICTNMVQWCASASVSFWDASLVNTLLQAGAGVSILVWGVSLIIDDTRTYGSDFRGKTCISGQRHWRFP